MIEHHYLDLATLAFKCKILALTYLFLLNSIMAIKSYLA